MISKVKEEFLSKVPFDSGIVTDGSDRVCSSSSIEKIPSEDEKLKFSVDQLLGKKSGDKRKARHSIDNILSTTYSPHVIFNKQDSINVTKRIKIENAYSQTAILPPIPQPQAFYMPNYYQKIQNSNTFAYSMMNKFNMDVNNNDKQNLNLDHAKENKYSIFINAEPDKYYKNMVENENRILINEIFLGRPIKNPKFNQITSRNNQIVDVMIQIIGKDNLTIVNEGYGIRNPMYKYDITEQYMYDKVDKNSDNTYTCKNCSVKCNSVKLVLRHLKCHTSIKKFLCTICFKGFNDTFDLKRHTRTHTGIRPYICEIDHCGKRFSQRCSLESHQKKLHGLTNAYSFKQRREKIFICEICGFTSKSTQDNVKHTLMKHPQ